ncbi:MAG: glycosyltransferase family 2 protein [Nitrososphaerota archaeon]|nr:glycosyltransferase family 2 protein [Nitrososphaerota archaeon]MDG6919937.1 glycosyltransferase family 2 protein [Nitrososphaerota archaeon]
MEEVPLVAVVVVAHNDDTSILSAAERVVSGSSYPNLTVIGINNGSEKGDSTVKVSDKVELVRTGLNEGFASACNIGARKAFAKGAKFVLLLNDDATPARGCIETMVESLREEPNVGLLCSAVASDGSDLVESAGDRYNAWLGLTLHSAKGRRLRDIARTRPRVDFAPAVALMARAERLLELGLLDTRYFMYLEDLDLSIRMKRAGYSLSCLTESYVSHASSSTSKQYPGLKEYYMMRNRFVLCLLLKRRFQLVTVALSTPWVLLFRVLRKFPNPDPDELKGLCYGVVDGMRLTYGPSSREAYSP